MFIQTQETPNPETLKFIPGVNVLTTGTAEFLKDDINISSSPLAESIFKIDGVESVFLNKDFLSVTKNNSQSWQSLKTLVLHAIMDHYLSGMPVMTKANVPLENKKSDAVNDDITSQIKELIEQRVRPAVAQDGGDITFDKFEDGVVSLKLQGACSGCPSSTMTLKSGIENMLKHYIPEVKEVVAV